MTVLILGLLIFIGVHSVSIVNRGWRDRMVERLGEPAWKGVYSIVAAVGLVLIIWGYGLSWQDPVFVYHPPVWLRHITLLLMIVAFPLLLAAYLPGRIQRATKNPMLLAVKLWALAHLLANGTVADLVLFGAFLAWAVVDLISVKRRPASAGGPPSLPATPANDVIAVVGGLALYVAFVIWLHEWLIGIAIMPG